MNFDAMTEAQVCAEMDRLADQTRKARARYKRAVAAYDWEQADAAMYEWDEAKAEEDAFHAALGRHRGKAGA